MKLALTKWFFPHDHKKNHFRSLDGLRGLAVLIVILSHASNAGVMFNEHLNFRGSGKFGVYLFFMLSAYLLDRQIAIAFLNNKSSFYYWLNYFLRRFLRIYPLYSFALITYFIFSYTNFMPTSINTFFDLPQHLLLLKGKGIFWSITVEFKYYFLSPLIMWICNKYLKWNHLKIFLFIFALALISYFISIEYKLGITSTLKFLPIFLSGTALSIYDIGNKKKFKQMPPVFFDILGILVLITIIMTFPYFFSTLFDIEIKFNRPPFNIVYVILCSLLLFSVRSSTGIITYFFSLKPLRFLGVISFSLYLVHFLVIPFVKNILRVPFEFQIYAIFIISILISTITYVLIELPLSKIRIEDIKLSEKESTLLK